VLLPNGEIAYTRASKWSVDSAGQILSVDGLLMEPAITIPEDATEIMVSPEGLVTVKIAGQDETEDVGQIELVRFVNPAALGPWAKICSWSLRQAALPFRAFRAAKG